MSYYGAPNYGGYPGQSSSPPGMMPGMGPGMGGPGGANGVHQGQHPLPARPGFSNFQMPSNMPKFDMNASVIRMGMPNAQKPESTSNRGSNAEPLGNRRGIGMDRGGLEHQRQQIRESMAALHPPKPDEILKTIFVGNITEGCGGDAGIESILRCAGSLRKWTRAMDANNKPCTFGFAEFEDSESLETAAEILKEVEVPLKKQLPKQDDQANGNDDDDKTNGAVEKATLLVMVDEASREYAANWRTQRGDSEEQVQFRIDGAKDQLNGVLARLFHPSEHDPAENVVMQDADHHDPITGEVITIQIPQGEDELADIPPEMRETVAAEIAAFRDRSIRRDMELLQREEEMEAQQRGGRSIPTGPGGSNGIPVGPRGMHGAPSGPKGLRGLQIPKDYQNGVSFTNGSNELTSYLGKEDDSSEVSDGELEQRRKEKREAEQEKAFLDYERRWQNRERARAAALERERKKDEAEEMRTAEDREIMAKKLKDWDDDYEASRRTHEYYADRASWAKHRSHQRQREAAKDDEDRRAEEAENRSAQQAEDQARGFADSFLDQQAEELGARGIAAKPRFTIQLGAAAQKAAQKAAAPKKMAVDVENLLNVDEIERDTSSKPAFIPIKFDTLAEAAALTDGERQEARRQLASSIPLDEEGLFAWDVKWNSLQSEVIEDQLRPFVEKRSMEYLGVVEDLMWDVVARTLGKHEGPHRLSEELEGLLEDETGSFVRKLWRMVVFYSESEARGLNLEESA